MAAIQAAQRDMLSASQVSSGQPPNQKKLELLVYQDCAFPGMYDDVMFPVATLYCPPQPPSFLPPRVKLPPRPGPVYKNDLAVAGEVEQRAQRIISAFWRGILCRRRLRNDRTYQHIIFIRCRTIQCWWRSVMAKRRFEQNKALKKEWIESRANNFLKERIQAMANIMTWQRSRYEGAAMVIQRVLRWFFSRLHRRRAMEEHPDLPEDQLPAVLPFPLKIRQKRYFPWRRPPAGAVSKDNSGVAGVSKRGEDDEPDEEAPRRTVLEFKKVKDPVEPPTMEYVREHNKRSMERREQRKKELEAPEVVSRLEWKREGLEEEDLDFNAGIIQRLFKTLLDSTAVRGEKISVAYLNNVVRTIARTFRMYKLILHMKRNRTGIQRKIKERRDAYAKRKIDEINLKMVWGKELLDQCAEVIQRCWHWYRYHRYGQLPLRVEKAIQAQEAREAAAEKAKEERREAIENGELDEESPEAQEGAGGDSGEELEKVELELPTPPPYHLIDHHLKREKELKDALMNALEKDRIDKEKNHKYVKYTPENPVVMKKVGNWIPTNMSQSRS